MRKGLFIGLLFGLLCQALSAQSILRMEEKRFNFGAKVGFNATLPVVNSLRINSKPVIRLVIWLLFSSASISSASIFSQAPLGIMAVATSISQSPSRR